MGYQVRNPTVQAHDDCTASLKNQTGSQNRSIAAQNSTTERASGLRSQRRDLAGGATRGAASARTEAGWGEASSRACGHSAAAPCSGCSDQARACGAWTRVPLRVVGVCVHWWWVVTRAAGLLRPPAPFPPSPVFLALAKAARWWGDAGREGEPHRACAVLPSPPAPGVTRHGTLWVPLPADGVA